MKRPHGTTGVARRRSKLSTKRVSACFQAARSDAISCQFSGGRPAATLYRKPVLWRASSHRRPVWPRTPRPRRLRAGSEARQCRPRKVSRHHASRQGIKVADKGWGNARTRRTMCPVAVRPWNGATSCTAPGGRTLHRTRSEVRREQARLFAGRLSPKYSRHDCKAPQRRVNGVRLLPSVTLAGLTPIPSSGKTAWRPTPAHSTRSAMAKRRAARISVLVPLLWLFRSGSFRCVCRAVRKPSSSGSPTAL